MRAFERGAATLGVQVARSFYDRWRRMPSARRTRLEGLAANVRERALEMRGEPERPVPAPQPPKADERLAEAMVTAAKADSDLSDIEVSDLRAELARELERLADADIRASRGPGNVAGETASADEQA